MVNKISVTILTKNSAQYIRQCLDALVNFTEIIILDNGSSDNTLDIVKEFSNVKIYKNDFIGFGKLKNLAIEYTSNDWILSIDSDEVLTAQLSSEILNMQLNKNTIYVIKRDNYYNGKKINCCTWQNDWVRRLFNKNTTKFSNDLVHESLILDDNINIKKLKYSFNHYSYDNVAQLLQKMDIYSTLWADNYYHKKYSSPTKAVLKSLFSFIRCYFFKKGFLYGYRGLLISVSNAGNVFYKYLKLYEKNQRK